ncbi:type II toxin-antitoxin system RelE/ParE family toxin [Paenibacillus elgii]
MYKIHFYEDARENCPFGNFIAELDQRAETDKRAAQLLKKVYYCLEILKEGGTRAGEKFTKHIDGKLWELRPGDHRVFFFLWNGNYFVLLHTFRKETKKTPPEEIEKAKREMEDWVSRNGH